jgi:catechol 2,3-dioxygenase-like lactoylglutathione lyase family enzyme
MDLGYFETSLPVKDIAASMAFYEAVGFERAEYAQDAGTATMILGDCRLGLFQGHLDPDRPQLIFWQGPIEAVADAAERAGLSFRVALHHDAEGGGAFMLDDPDGHPLFFIRMKTFYPQYPAHTQAAPAERPKARAIDSTAGWFEASLPVADIASSVAFYEALGFETVIRETKSTRVSVQNADCRIGLFQGHLEPDRPQLIFWQGDMAAMAERVRRAGLGFHVEPRGDNDHGAFMLTDPDGHPLYFIRMPGVTRTQPDPTRAVPA